MADHIKTRQISGTWVVRAAGAVIGESQNTIELSEGDYPPVIYFPRGDIAMAFLDKTNRITTCRHKGDATHYTIQAKSGPLDDAAWSYESPLPGVADIKDYLAFYPDRVTVEQV